MKLIGITGKSGAGKTTLANIFAKNKNVGVIHVDELMEKVKEKKLSKIMDKNEDGTPLSIKKNIRKILYGNKHIFLMYIKCKGLFLNKKIKRQIRQYEEQGKKAVVIECVHLKYFPIFKQLDRRILVQRPYIERQKSVLQRDKDKNMDKEIFSMWDLPYKRSYYKEDIGSYDYNITNKTKTQLEELAQRIYNELIEDVDIWKKNLKVDICDTIRKERIEVKETVKEIKDVDVGKTNR